MPAAVRSRRTEATDFMTRVYRSAVPLLLAEHDGGTIKGDRHLVYPKGKNPMTNLQLTLLQRLGVPVEHFGDSTGTLKELTGLS